MKIAYCMGAAHGAPDRLLERFATQLIAAGTAVCGTVQINSGRSDVNGRCDMDVRVLPDGPEIRISQSLGAESRGCRLDSQALAAAAGHTAALLDQGAALLIINKYGKTEIEGGGFREVIGVALSREIPVLVGLNARNKPAFLEFTGDMAVELPPEEAALHHWFGSPDGIRLDAPRTSAGQD